MILLDKHKPFKSGPNSQIADIITKFYFLPIFSVSQSCLSGTGEILKGRKALGPDRQG